MDGKSVGRKANLKQYRAVNGKWQFVPVLMSPSVETASTADSLSVNLVTAGHSASWSPGRAPAIGPGAWLTSDPHRVACWLGTLTSPGRNGLMAESKTVDKDSRRTFSAALEYAIYFDSLIIASAALPATTQFADPATTASSSNQRNPKSSMHSGKSGLMMMYPGITAPGM